MIHANRAWIALIGTVAMTVAMQGQRAEAAEWKATTLIQDSMLYKSPDAKSEVLGRYPRGTRIRVYHPGRNGWYSTYLSKPVKGVQYAWLPANTLDLNVGGASAANTPSREKKEGPLTDPNTWVTAGIAMTMAAPSEMQTAIGDTAAGISLLNISAGAGRYFGDKFFVTVRGGMFTLPTPASAAGAYTASGLWGTLGLGYMFMRSNSYSVGFELAGGISLCTAGNSARSTADSKTYSLTTSGIMGTPINVGITGKVPFSSKLGLEAQAGYLMHTLSAVPFFKLNTASTQVTPNVSLGGLSVGARLYLGF